MKKYLLIGIIVILSLGLGIFANNKLSYDFSTLEGSKIQYQDLQGKWVVVNYFAEWCAPCLREIPELNQFAALTDSSQVVLYGVSFDKLQDHELDLIANKYNIEYALINEVVNPMPFEMPQYLPATFIIRPDGKLAGQLLGEQSAETLIEAIGL